MFYSINSEVPSQGATQEGGSNGRDRELGHTREQFFAEAFARNIGIFSPAEQLELQAATVAIPGMGGVGGSHLATLARLGIGGFHLADFDTFELANTNRQYGARCSTRGKSKIEVMTLEALDINPYLEIKTFPEGLHRNNVEQFLDGVDVVVDSLDFFAIDIRRKVMSEARRRGIPAITAGPIGFTSALLVFTADSMPFDEYFDFCDELGTEECILRFQLGLAPKLGYLRQFLPGSIRHDRRAGPSLGLACALCAAAASSEVARVVLKKSGVRPAPHYTQYDLLNQKIYRGYIPYGNKNPMQKLKRSIVQRLLRKGSGETQLSSHSLPQWIATSETQEVPKAVTDFLLSAGAQAPSGDNAQPWKLSAQKMSITLSLDPARDRSFFNVAERASLIACGAATENISVAAHAFALETQVRSIHTGDSTEVHIGLSPIEEPEVGLLEEIWQRATDRSMYFAKPLLPSTVTALSESISEFEGAQLHFLSERKDLKSLRNICYHADRLRVTRRDLHEHFQSTLRTNKTAIESTGDGLPLKNLQVGLAGELFLRGTRSWSIAQLLNTFGAEYLLASIATRGLRHCTGAVLLTVPTNTAPDFFMGGRALQRLWLTLTKLGLSMQPMTAATLFLTRVQMEGYQKFSEREQQILDRIWPSYSELFPHTDLEKTGHVMLLRFGHGAGVCQRTLRRPSNEGISC